MNSDKIEYEIIDGNEKYRIYKYYGNKFEIFSYL